MNVSPELLILIVVVAALGWTLIRQNQKRTSALHDAGGYPAEGAETDADVTRLLQHGQKIAAIKVYRALHRVGLKEAKDAVERRQQEMGLPGGPGRVR